MPQQQRQKQTRRAKAKNNSPRRATVAEILSTGEILVEFGGRPSQRMLCDFLQNATNNQLALQTGDVVLVQPAATLEDKGIVLGKVGAYKTPETKKIELQADEELTIRCGEGFITLRESGQILIKGLDVVSHAKRNNQVRGGSIQLN